MSARAEPRTPSTARTEPTQPPRTPHQPTNPKIIPYAPSRPAGQPPLRRADATTCHPRPKRAFRASRWPGRRSHPPHPRPATTDERQPCHLPTTQAVHDGQPPRHNRPERPPTHHDHSTTSTEGTPARASSSRTTANPPRPRHHRPERLPVHHDHGTTAPGGCQFTATTAPPSRAAVSSPRRRRP